MTTTYDPRGLSWDYWCRLMDELFTEHQLGVRPESEWREFAHGMASNGYFAQMGIPDGRLFKDWRDWASALVHIVDVI